MRCITEYSACIIRKARWKQNILLLIAINLPPYFSQPPIYLPTLPFLNLLFTYQPSLFSTSYLPTHPLLSLLTPVLY